MLLALRTVGIITDYNNLKYFLTTKKLLGRQAYAAKALSQYDIKILFQAGKKNLADRLSRRLDYSLEEGDDAEADMLPILQDLFIEETQRRYRGQTANAKSKECQTGVEDNDEEIEEIVRHNVEALQRSFRQLL